MGSVFANENPVHCAHLSLTPAKDPNGEIKCQMGQKLLVEDLFTKADIDTFTQICGNAPELGNEECSLVVKKKNDKKEFQENSKKEKEKFKSDEIDLSETPVKVRTVIT